MDDKKVGRDECQKCGTEIDRLKADLAKCREELADLKSCDLCEGAQDAYVCTLCHNRVVGSYKADLAAERSEVESFQAQLDTLRTAHENAIKARMWAVNEAEELGKRVEALTDAIRQAILDAGSISCDSHSGLYCDEFCANVLGPKMVKYLEEAIKPETEPKDGAGEGK